MGRRIIDRTGEIVTMKCGLWARIVAYRHANDIDIEFENGAIAKNKTYRHFIAGATICPLTIEIIGDYAAARNWNLNPTLIFYLDIQDLHILGDFPWCIDGKGYVQSGKRGKLHKLIMNAPPELVVDHVDGNKLDNRRQNLRVCTSSQNTFNQCVRANNTSGYKGVHWKKQNKIWVAYIHKNNQRIHLGHFGTAELAAEAYNEAAIKYHGEFARLNKI